MGLFTAYLDASGDSDKQPFVVVSGYIANLTQWIAIENIWKSIHEEFRVNLPFHMADFVAAGTNEKYKNQSNARADYVELAKDPVLWRHFLQQLVNAQVCMIHCNVAAVIRMNVYNEVDALIELKEHIPPYALGARYCVDRIREWEKEFESADPVEMIFEEGDLGQTEFSRIMVGEGSDLPIYKKKKDFAGLQAIDHYCWELTNRLKSQEKEKELNREFPPRIELVYLYESIPKLHIEPTTQTLLTICQERGFKARAWKNEQEKRGR